MSENTTAEAKSAGPPPRRYRHLPFFPWVLIGFLLADTALRAIYAINTLAEQDSSRAAFERHVTDIVICAVNLLLALQTFVRSIAARIWGTVFFLLQLAQIIIWQTLRHPEDWLAEEPAGRLQIVARILFLCAALVIINRPHPRPLIAE